MALLMFRDSIVGQLCRWLFQPQSLLYPNEKPCQSPSYNGIISSRGNGEEHTSYTYSSSKNEEFGVASTVSKLETPTTDSSTSGIAQGLRSPDPVDPEEWATWKKVVVGAEIWYASTLLTNQYSVDSEQHIHLCDISRFIYSTCQHTVSSYSVYDHVALLTDRRYIQLKYGVSPLLASLTIAMYVFGCKAVLFPAK
mgnify:CR=1 FL=1